MTQNQPRAAFLGKNALDVTAVVLSLAVAACLAIDAYVHLTRASDYDAVKTSTLSQGDLFRVEGVVAAVVAVLLLVRRRRWSWALAAAVLTAGFAAVVVYNYVNVGQIGPIPNMYEPSWALQGKKLSAWAEGIGAALALAGLLKAHLRWRQLADSQRAELTSTHNGRSSLGDRTHSIS